MTKVTRFYNADMTQPHDFKRHAEKIYVILSIYGFIEQRREIYSNAIWIYMKNQYYQARIELAYHYCWDGPDNFYLDLCTRKKSYTGNRGWRYNLLKEYEFDTRECVYKYKGTLLCDEKGVKA